MFQRVRVRLTLLSVAIFICLYAVSSLAVYAIVRHVVLQSIDARLDIVVRQILHRNAPFVLSNLPMGIYGMVGTPNQVISNLPDDLFNAISPFVTAHAGVHPWAATFNAGGDQVYRLIYEPELADPFFGTIQYVVVVGNIARELSVLQRLLHVLALVGGAGVLISTLAGFLFAERALKPIRTAWQRQLDFVADASHELRTPLAVIQSNLNIVMEHSHETVLDNMEWLNNAHSEARRLSRLVEDLLTLARSDSGAAPLSVSALNLGDLVRRVGELFEPVAAARGLTLQVEAPDLTIEGDPDRLHQLLVILLDNACKFTPAGGRVTVRLTRSRHQAVIQVQDTGIGIPEADLPHIFERFYRADKARARTASAGAGLGLSIARWIVDAHQGKIQVASREGEGTTVTVQLPAP
ncbi:two-component sensor histidine kinase [Alicyclobacillus cellulosilyticus]|uniref:histidine kinase n=1 Tax=Alicyclobacillus cellulosilyticus TaxID=1003997 RepID=A0A917KDP8_9BACL|nr:ATP-binding protein [Alicyclobacillus cellulosilyticus]GGJ08628.1 two-component sensor histidine kinase [Alicyclobacillus cellulosilyticus]